MVRILDILAGEYIELPEKFFFRTSWENDFKKILKNPENTEEDLLELEYGYNFYYDLYNMKETLKQFYTITANRENKTSPHYIIYFSIKLDEIKSNNEYEIQD